MKDQPLQWSPSWLKLSAAVKTSHYNGLPPWLKRSAVVKPSLYNGPPSWLKRSADVDICDNGQPL